MGFLSFLFGSCSRARPPAAAVAEIAALLEPLVRPAASFDLYPVDGGSALPLLSSHFGGRPYLERGESWPGCEECRRELDFVCQLDLTQTRDIAPGGTRLLTFFAGLSCDHSPPGWALRTYGDPRPEKAVDPPTLRPHREAKGNFEGGQLRLRKGAEVRPCRVTLVEAKSLPDWESARTWCPEGAGRSSAADLDGDPWAAYKLAAGGLVGEGPPHLSYLGGYPRWIQGDETPTCPRCRGVMSLLLTIGSDDETNLNWTDLGAVYIFHCLRHPEERELVEQFF